VGIANENEFSGSGGPPAKAGGMGEVAANFLALDLSSLFLLVILASLKKNYVLLLPKEYFAKS
jgi:hypothetical protein